jgi:AcrR family transcriptional regulator
METKSTTDSERRRRVLDAALVTFARFGFRKTSMDEIARVADISRQGLYFYFRNKDDLFRETVQKWFDDGLEAVESKLSQDDVSIDDRLISAMDAWFGRQVELLGSDTTDLIERSNALVGDMFFRCGAAFQTKLEAAIDKSELTREAERRGLASADIARLLYRCALGWKQARLTRAEFLKQMTIAVRLICRSGS